MVAHIQSGTNDLCIGGKTDTDLQVTLQRMLRLLRAQAGGVVKIVVSQLLPRKNTTTAPWDATREGYRTNYNGYVPNNADTYKADLVFQRGDPASTMGGPNAPDDATLYNNGTTPDKLHPINLGQQQLATGQPTPPAGPASLQAAVNALWA